ncbi:hypothetical protein BOTBODRAFT_154422 [Botryobasidium botryosum FD-172 SS1]|uniref:37S ribosomal protein mrp10, mitochondrial n=1 Tax=Botryobasidium botryosum (strain FD-172 SS1) TaxID=930990 RepID=A0A067N2Y8_BOTB1|nr:hypothetical protein BOTBODRAFT_154422 [Botryobasidium botryosum FD-172 SS1]
MKISKLKVKPRKVAYATPCATELATMLGCWASAGNVGNSAVSPCADTAKALHDCMRTSAKRGKPPKSTLNYHLARLGKHI